MTPSNRHILSWIIPALKPRAAAEQEADENECFQGAKSQIHERLSSLREDETKETLKRKQTLGFAEIREGTGARN